MPDVEVDMSPKLVNEGHDPQLEEGGKAGAGNVENTGGENAAATERPGEGAAAKGVG